MIQDIIELGNFGQSLQKKKLSAYFARNIISITKINKVIRDLSDRIYRLSSDTEREVKEEVSKSFGQIFELCIKKNDEQNSKNTKEKLKKKYTLFNADKEKLKEEERKNEGIDIDYFQSYFLPVIKNYLQNEESFYILYNCFKLSLLFNNSNYDDYYNIIIDEMLRIITNIGKNSDDYINQEYEDNQNKIDKQDKIKSLSISPSKTKGKKYLLKKNTFLNDLQIKFKSNKTDEQPDIVVSFNLSIDLNKLLKLLKKLISRNTDSIKAEKLKIASRVLKNKFLKPCLLIKDYFLYIDIFYDNQSDKDDDILFFIDKFIEQYNKYNSYSEVKINNIKNKQGSDYFSNINTLLECIPNNVIRLKYDFFIKNIYPLYLDQFNKIPLSNSTILIEILNSFKALLSSIEEESDLCQLVFNLIYNNQQSITFLFERFSDWRELDALVSLLSTSTKLFDNESFLDNIIKYNKAFFNVEENKIISNKSESMPLITSSSSGLKSSNDKIIEVTQKSNKQYKNTKYICIHIDLDISLIKVSSNKHRDDIILYLQKFFLKNSFYEQRHIIYFFEKIIQNFSFNFFNVTGLSNIFFELLLNGCFEIRLLLLDFSMKLYPILMEQDNLKTDYEKSINSLRLLLKSNELTVYKQSRLKKMIEKYDKFKINILTLNFDQIIKEDCEKYYDISAFLENRNCHFLFISNKTHSNNPTSSNSSFHSKSLKGSSNEVRNSCGSMTLNSIQLKKFKAIDNTKDCIITPRATVKSMSKMNTNHLKSPEEKINSERNRHFSPQISLNPISSLKTYSVKKQSLNNEPRPNNNDVLSSQNFDLLKYKVASYNKSILNKQAINEKLDKPVKIVSVMSNYNSSNVPNKKNVGKLMEMKETNLLSKAIPSSTKNVNYYTKEAKYK